MTTLLYLCIYLSIEGKQYSAVADNLVDASKVASDICQAGSQAKDECTYVECRETGK